MPSLRPVHGEERLNLTTFLGFMHRPGFEESVTLQSATFVGSSIPLYPKDSHEEPARRHLLPPETSAGTKIIMD